MFRPIAVLLALVVVLVHRGGADEVQWKSAPTPRVQPVDVKTERSKATSGVEYGPLRSSPSAEPPVTPAKPIPEPLGQPRQLLPDVQAAKPARMKLVPPNDDHLKTVTLLSEQPYSAEPPAIEPGRRFYASAEYLLWFTSRMNAPPLVTTAQLPANPDLGPGFGVIGGPGTTILAGNGPVGQSFHMGARFTVGAWFDCEQTCGIEAGYFFLGRNRDVATFSSTNTPVLLRPFIQVNAPGGPNFQIVAFPPGFTQNGLPFPDQAGSVRVEAVSGLWGAEVNARECLASQGTLFGGCRIDAFAGFRYLDLDDRLSVTEIITLGDNNIAGFPTGTAVIVNDRFTTHNQFYGGQAGLKWEYHRRRFVTDGRAALAIGGTHQVLRIDGEQRVTPPGQPAQFFTGGLLALPSNIGRFSNSRFSFVPEVTANVGWMATPRLKLFGGYNFLYWTNVARAAEQIDPVLDLAQIPNFNDPNNPPTPVNPPRPAVLFQQSGFWAQGAQVGLELRW